eukprot:357584-Chlamydomonas_euryale.AAC.4
MRMRAVAQRRPPRPPTQPLFARGRPNGRWTHADRASAVLFDASRRCGCWSGRRLPPPSRCAWAGDPTASYGQLTEKGSHQSRCELTQQSAGLPPLGADPALCLGLRACMRRAGIVSTKQFPVEIQVGWRQVGGGGAVDKVWTNCGQGACARQTTL